MADLDEYHEKCDEEVETKVVLLLLEVGECVHRPMSEEVCKTCPRRKRRTDGKS